MDLHLVNIGRNDMCTGCRERERGGAADPLARSRDKCGLAVKASWHHEISSAEGTSDPAPVLNSMLLARRDGKYHLIEAGISQRCDPPLKFGFRTDEARAADHLRGDV